ncbi:MAG: spore coat protein [Bacilli bacterium]|nr:spore coat protein [Bacilli bacterium]
MNDELIMNNYLLNLKSTVEVFVHGTLESSNISVRATLKECLDEIMNAQEKVYNEMTKYGWYSVNNVEISQITQVLNKLNSKN